MYDILNRRNGAASLRRPVMPPSGTLLVFGVGGGGGLFQTRGADLRRLYRQGAFRAGGRPRQVVRSARYVYYFISLPRCCL